MSLFEGSDCEISIRIEAGLQLTLEIARNTLLFESSAHLTQTPKDLNGIPRGEAKFPGTERFVECRLFVSVQWIAKVVVVKLNQP